MSNAIIKANRKLFKLIISITNFDQTFLFREKCLIVQIQIFENCKIKIFSQVIIYTKLIINILKNAS